MKAEELDELFDMGEDITPYLDLSTKERPGHKQIRFDTAFLEWMTKSPDLHSKSYGRYKTGCNQDMDCRKTQKRDASTKNIPLNQTSMNFALTSHIPFIKAHFNS